MRCLNDFTDLINVDVDGDNDDNGLISVDGIPNPTYAIYNFYVVICNQAKSIFHPST